MKTQNTYINAQGYSTDDFLKKLAYVCLEDIENLILDESNITDNDKEAIEKISQLINLRKLSIADMEINDLSFLENLTNLEEIDISGTQVSDLSILQQLPNLRQIYAHDTPVTSLWSLAKLTQLRVLKMERSQVRSLEPLKEVRSLEILDLYGNEAIADITPLSKLENLKELTIKGTKIYDPNQLNCLEGLRRLEELNVNVEIEFAANAVLRKVKENSKKPQSMFFKVKTDAKQLVKGELLESFNEILLGELEELTDIKEEDVRNLLIDILYEDRPVEEVVKYVSEAEIDFGKRFAIIYCCLNPHRWEDSWMKDYKTAMLESYVDRSYDMTGKNSIKDKEFIEGLKDHANFVAKAFLDAKNIQKRTLTKPQLQKKEEILHRIANKSTEIEITEDVKLLEIEKNALKEIISNEGEKNLRIVDIAKPSIVSSQIPINSWKLTSSYERWNEIYDLIKETPKGHFRKPDKMLEIVRAVLYKEEKNCPWSELPRRNLPPSSTVRHYYYEWKVNGNLEKIKQIVSEAAPTKRHTVP